jgi:hypothetical protein
METLKLEHLSAYLPYGLKVMYYPEDDNGKLIQEDWHLKPKEIYSFNQLEIMKQNILLWLNAKSAKFATTSYMPILYPLSSLTETIWYEGKEINPSEFIKDWYNEKYAGSIDDLEYYALENEFALFGAVHETLQSEAEIIAMPYQAYQLLFKMKIDIFGLIEKGLALDVNNLETNPYK